MKYKVLDLFCGAGGLSLGFQMADFKIMGGVEFDKDAMNTHELNFPDGYNFCGDISSITDEEILERFQGKIDVIIGGPPCQGFSAANMWQGSEEKEEKNKLFFEFIRFIKLLNPKSFVMENVRQILTKDKGFVKETMLKIMNDELGYNMSVEVLDASKFGVPQKRHRAFFVGFRKDLNINFDFKTMKNLPVVTVEDAISDLYHLDKTHTFSDISSTFKLQEKPKSKYQSYLRKITNGVINNHNIKYPNEKVQKRISHVPEGENWKKVPEHLWDTTRNNRHSSAYRRLNSKLPSITIDTGHMNYFHPIYNRVPTVRESARIQSFPDDFIFTGTQGAQFRQVGNAVPPLLSKAIGTTIMKYLNTVKKEYNTIDLFSGAGGFSTGFDNAGFKTILALDLWKDAIDTFNYNRDKKVGINMDIHDYTNEKIDELVTTNDVDGIIGGPPCQGFSLVGTRKETDERNSLYLEYVRFVEKVKPKFFILENVKGLLSLKKGFFKEDIIKRFTELGYNVNYKLLKASEYGIPQNRERVFFVGLRKDLFKDTFFEFPIGSHTRAVSTSEALSDLPSLDNNENQEIYKTEPLNDFQKMMRKNSIKILNNDITVHTKQTKDIINMVPDGGNIRDLPEKYYSVRNYNTAFKRMNSALPSTTIDCGHRNYFHYKEDRVPTVRESARIQTFPDNYFFTGSKTSQYKQVGNAVPAYLAEQLGNKIKKMLDEL